MKCTKYLFIIVFAISVFSCSDGEDTPMDKPLEPDKPSQIAKSVTFTTDIYTRAVITEFGEDAEMNVYAKEFKTLDANNVLEKELKSVNKNGVWNITPEIKLKKDEKAYLYAVYPYRSSNLNPKTIKVEAASQTDYLYSGKGVMASFSEPKVSLTMSHALSVLAFNICKSSYSLTGKLKSIKVSGDNFGVSGELNVESGKISAVQKGEIHIDTSAQITEEGWTTDLPQTFSLPNISDGKNIKVTFNVDDKDYIVFLPNINIEQGMKYVFRLGLTNNGMTLFTDQTQVVSLKKTDDELPENGGVSELKIQFTGSSFVVPKFTGNSLIPGWLNWGDESLPGVYYEGASHIYKNKGTYNINIENWNVKEVSFKSLQGIDFIDFTNF